MRFDRRILGLLAAAILAVVALAAPSPARAHGGAHASPHGHHRDGTVRPVAPRAAVEAWTRVAPMGAAGRARVIDARGGPAGMGVGMGVATPEAARGCCPAGCRCTGCAACSTVGILPQASPDLPPPGALALRPRRDAAAGAAAPPEALPEPPRRGA